MQFSGVFPFAGAAIVAANRMGNSFANEALKLIITLPMF
jgi:hypothetical protein